MVINSKNKLSIRRLAIIGMLGGISAIMGLTPLGFIPVGPTRATLMHIPVIIGAIVEGPVVGAMVGLIFGVFSIIQAIMNPTIVSFVFLNPLVSVIPRILIGITAYYSYILFKRLGRGTSIFILFTVWIATIGYLINTIIKNYNNPEVPSWQLIFTGALALIALAVGYFSYKKFKDQAVEIVLSAAIGTLTNTIGVLMMIYYLYAGQFVEKLGGDVQTAGKFIAGIGLANGIPESIVAMLIVTSVVMALKKRN